MNALKIGPTRNAAVNPDGAGDSFVDLVMGDSCEALVIAGEAAEGTVTLPDAFPGLQALAKLQSLRVAVKVRGRIIFIHLGDVVSVRAQGNYVLLERGSSSYLLRDSISAVAEKLGPYGFIRIHRSIVVNVAFVEGIRPFDTGQYGLQIRGGKEYTVTRTYKKNLTFLAKFWIGTGCSFPD